ncbi:nucleotidyltransferase family protein [Xanthovirga aplysinae]|uniref:nucleotidyltransferase family protein n=1 Tax=Xanthovirga aplysinae TaxID=2529853 RepID=UPI0012BBED9E|nr:nucleotidyltransferase family protein [Xanthovirga aplysinae]MTI31147.1 nucleotidyltransferase family protein [Xanthovirga aplysinae]
MDLAKESERLINIIEKSFHLKIAASALYELEIEDCYIGAGAIAQTVWNELTNRPVDYGIEDIDIIYHNPLKVKEEDEEKILQYLNESLGEYPYRLDVKNEARVHLWYREKFGYDIAPYKSVESAINTWPTTATSLGVRKLSEKSWEIYAPFGLKDVFNLKIRANNRQITQNIYNKKVEKWIKKWPELDVLPWDDRLIPFVEDKRIFINRKHIAL